MGLIDLVREDYAEQNIHYLGPMFGGDYDLLTKESVTRHEDMKIRATPSISIDKMLTLCGGHFLPYKLCLSAGTT